MRTLCLVAAAIALLSLPAAAQEPRSAILNPAVGACLKKYGDLNAECLMDAREKSDEDVERIYKNKLSELTVFDNSTWWMASKAQQAAMISAFKESQGLWLKYRDSYCRAATAPVAETKSLGAALAGCVINMNQQREQEILRVKADLTFEDY